MKNFILSIALLFTSSQAFAVAQADYKCGPYTYSIFGPYHASLWDARGNEVGRWEQEDPNDPTSFRGEQLVLKWKGRVYRCEIID